MKGLDRQTIETRISDYLMDHYQQLYRLAYSYVKNEQDAMDMVQESAYKAIRAWKSVKDAEHVGTWLYRIVINTSLDHLRKHKNEVIGVDDYEIEVEDTYEDVDIMNSLNILNESERTIVILRYFEDRKLEEIAEVVDEPVNTVKSKLYRSLRKLKVVLNGEMEGAL